jgi:imidazolonepropionase-like amidohydrolase
MGSGPSASSVLLRNAAMWDGVPDHEIEAATSLLIEAGRITRVTPGAIAAPRDVATVDLSRRFVIPGLIDMHVYLVWSGAPDPARVVDQESEQLTTIRALANAQQELRAGVTAVRDLGGYWDIPLAVAQAVDTGLVEGPTIVASGQTIIMTGGHDPFWGIASDGPDAVIRAVRHQVSLGTQVIKVAATGGVYGRPEGEEIGQSELTFEELKAAADEAHRFGLKVAAHALGRAGIANAVRAGIDTIEHGNFLDEALVHEMKSRGTVLCPTLAIYRRIAEGTPLGIPAYAVAKAQQAVDSHRESFRMAMEAGIPIVAGTDAGSCATPHPALVAELELMHVYGMPVHQVLACATSTAAQVLGRPALGTIEPGKLADLLILDSNPLEDLSRLRSPAAVVKAGRVAMAASEISRPHAEVI